MSLRRDYVLTPQTLYIGGGTPSLYAPLDLGDLVATAKEVWKVDFKEVTVEINPEDATDAYLGAIAKSGVNRLSFGIQSFFDEHLRFMNRRHNAAQGIKAVQSARRLGFSNVSVDLIFGFRGLTHDQWRQNLEQALALFPQHLSAYQLSMEPGTPFYKAFRKGLLPPVDDEVAAHQYALLQEVLSAARFSQYEVSNFALQGYRSMHNSFYWNGTPYLGLGPSAHSYNGYIRHANVANVRTYIERIGEGAVAAKGARLTPVKRYNEFVMTRLRRAEGFLLQELRHHVRDPRHLHYFEQASARLLERGLLIKEEGCIKIPPAKWFVMDGIIVDLLV